MIYTTLFQHWGYLFVLDWEENHYVAQNTYAVSWFKGRKLNMVFGICLF